MNPEINSVWTYYGPHPGCGERHHVVFCKNGIVTTCALSHAFNGPIEMFRQFFKFTEAAP